MNSLQIFNFEENEIRTLQDNEKAWFAAMDVTDILGYVNGPDAVKKHCKHAKILKHSDSLCLGFGPRGITIIPESDVYRLVIKSKLPAADRLESFVMEDILPAVRKTGSYGVSDVKNAELIVQLAQQQLKLVEDSSDMKNRVSVLEKRMAGVEVKALPVSSVKELPKTMKKVIVKDTKAEWSRVSDFASKLGIVIPDGLAQTVGKLAGARCKEEGFLPERRKLKPQHKTEFTFYPNNILLAVCKENDIL